MEAERNDTTNCPNCGTPAPAEIRSCQHCGAALQTLPVPQPVALRLPLLAGPTWVTLVLLTINLLVWLLMGVAGGLAAQLENPADWFGMIMSGGSTDAQVLLDFGAKYGPAILEGELWRLFTPMFLHIGLAHLAFNSYALYSLGQETERFFGRGRFLALYLLTGVLSIAASYLISPNLAAGASGAIFGLVGALGAFFYRQRKVLGRPGQRRLNNLLLVVVINAFYGFSQANIDNGAHLGGLVTGLLMGWVIAPQYTLQRSLPPALPRIVDRNPLTKNWWLIPAGLALTAGLTLLGNLREGNTGQAYLQQGEQALNTGDWDGAIESLTAALDRDPQLWSAYLYRAEAYLQVDRDQAALDDFEIVTESEATLQQRALAYTGRGRITMLRGDPFDALADLDTAVSLDPQEPFARLVRGLVYFEMGELEAAQTDLELALDLGLVDPRSSDAANDVLGIIRIQLGN